MIEFNKVLNKIYKSRIILVLIFLLGFLFRLYRINFPLADWHSWRQTDTAAVSYRFKKEGINLLKPKYFDISNIQSGKFNPEGYRMVEFPLFNFFHFLTDKILRFLPLTFEGAGRLVSIFCSMSSGLFLYLLLKQITNKKIAFWSLFLFMFLPFNIFYSRVILPEPLLVCLSLSASYIFYQYLKKDNLLLLILFTFFTSASFLVKPTAVFFYLPLVYLTVKEYKKDLKKYILPAFLSILAVAPFLLWRSWIKNYPEGIPAYTWLLNGDGIRFRPAFFRWIFAERLGKLILGYYGLFFLGLGLTHVKKYRYPILFFLSFILYITIFATGNVRHDYYQIIVVPSLVTVMAVGLARYLISYYKALIAVIFLIFTLAFSFYEVKGFFNINNPAIVKAGKAVQEKVPEDALVIAPYNGDTAFLYQTKRRGWPIGFEIQDKIKKGADYYVSVNYDDEARDLISKYQVIEQTKDYVIINLRSTNN